MSESRGVDDAPTRVVEPPSDAARDEDLAAVIATDGEPRYTLLECLGRGGAGVVYAAHDAELDRRVAIKLVRADASGSTGASDGQDRLLREARALARLAHPNVIHVYDVAPYDPDRIRQAFPQLAVEDEIPSERGVFLVLELVEGDTLGEWLASKPRGWREALQVMIPAGRGLRAAHEQGLIHRDFKPGNVLVGHDGRVRVLDFGLARVSAGDPSDPEAGSRTGGDAGTTSAPDLAGALVSRPLTQTGTVMGTPKYMAPEQHRGQPATEAADVYAYCVVLYEAVFGRVPFPGKSLRELRDLKEAGKIPEPSADLRFPSKLWALIVRGLSPRAEDRFPSMARLLAQLEALPGAARRRAITATVIVVSTLGIGVAAAGWYEARESRCEGQELELAGVWDGAVKARVKAAVLATAVPYARAAWANVEATVDEYAGRWMGLRRDVCRATRIEAAQSVAVMQWRYDCLDAALDGVAALRDRLENADQAAVERAVDLATTLPPLQRCESAGIAEAELARDDDERIRRRALDRELASVETLVRTNRLAEGVELARELAGRARDERLPDVEASASLWIGLAASMQEGQGDLMQSELNRAITLAEEAGAEDVATRAQIALVMMTKNAARIDDSERLAQQVAARLRRRARDDELDAEFQRVLGALRQAQGRYEDALAAFERSHDLRVGLRSGDSMTITRDGDPKIAQALGAMGSAEYQLSHFDRARELYERSFEGYRASLGDAHPRVAYALQRMAGVARMTGERRLAVEHGERALEILEAAYGPTHPDVADALGDLASLYQGIGDNDRALKLHERSIELTGAHQGKQHPNYARRLGNYGLTLVAVGRIDDAVEAHREQLAINERVLGSDHPDVGYPHNYLASALRRAERFAEAKEHATRAVAIFGKTLGREHHLRTEAVTGLARVEAKLGNEKKARELLEEVVTIHDGLESVDGGSRGSTLFDLAKVLPASQSDRARELAIRARQAFRSVEALEAAQRVDDWLSRRDVAR